MLHNVLSHPANFSPFVASVDDIATLPWIGNYASDYPLFHAIDDFIVNRAESVEVACAALHALSQHGMGVEDPVSQEELCLYLTETELKPLQFSCM